MQHANNFGSMQKAPNRHRGGGNSSSSSSSGSGNVVGVGAGVQERIDTNDKINIINSNDENIINSFHDLPYPLSDDTRLYSNGSDGSRRELQQNNENITQRRVKESTIYKLESARNKRSHSHSLNDNNRENMHQPIYTNLQYGQEEDDIEPKEEPFIDYIIKFMTENPERGPHDSIMRFVGEDFVSSNIQTENLRDQKEWGDKTDPGDSLSILTSSLPELGDIMTTEEVLEKTRDEIWDKMVHTMATNTFLCEQLNKDWQDMRKYLKEHLLTNKEWKMLKTHSTTLKQLKARYRSELQGQSMHQILQNQEI